MTDFGTALTDPTASPGTIGLELFQCPGERQPISRAIHLSRLAAGYASCRDCPHRQQTGSLPQAVVRRIERTAGADESRLVVPEGVRGIYQNDFTRERLAAMVERVVDVVEERRVHTSRALAERPLRVLTGHDLRASSPDLAIGVVSTLRMWGCDVADLGPVTPPAFRAAINRYSPELSIHVTGGLKPASWTGLDLYDEQGLPWSESTGLAALRNRMLSRPARRSRTSGTYTLLQIQEEYEQLVADQFHAIRPFKVVIGCREPTVQGLIQRLLEGTPCRFEFQPVSFVEGSSPQLLKDFPEAICHSYADLGLVIGADHGSCRLFDERGYELTVSEVVTLLQQGLPLQLRETAPLLPDESTDQVPTAELVRIQREQRVPIAAEACGRYWLQHEVPRCDAIETLAAVLQTLSLSERPLSSHILKRRRPATRRPTVATELWRVTDQK